MQQPDNIFGGAAIGWIDITVTISYIVGIVALGCWAGTRSRKNGSQAKDYFLAGSTLRWPVIGLALFARKYGITPSLCLFTSIFIR